MLEKYRIWHRIQGISCLCYAVFMICLYWMIYAELSNLPIIVMGIMAALSLIVTFTAGFVRAYIGHKMGLKSTKREWFVVGIALILCMVYFIFKYL